MDILRCECVAENQINQIMLTDLQNLQPVGPVTDSTEPAESRGQTGYLHSEVDRYTKRIVDLIIDDTCASVPEILRRTGWGVEVSTGRAVAREASYICSEDHACLVGPAAVWGPFAGRW